MGKDDVIEDLNQSICLRINQAFDFLLGISNENHEANPDALKFELQPEFFKDVSKNEI